MSPDDRVSPELASRLQELVDGALSETEAAALRAEIDGDAAAERALEALIRERDALSALFRAEVAAMAAAAPDPLAAAKADLARAAAAAERTERSARSVRAPWWRALAPQSGLGWIGAGGLATVGLAAGLLIGAFGAAPAPPVAGAPGWRMSAAVYQRLYTADTFAIAPVSALATRAGLARVGAALEMDLAALETPDTLELARAQLLSFKGRPLAQISFVTPDGAAIALCLIRKEPGSNEVKSVAVSQILDLAAVDWGTETHDFLLIGDAAPDVMEAIARRFAAQLG